MRMRVESGIEKCVSLNVIYSRQFYAFKARLSALHLSGIKAMRKRQRRHIGNSKAAGFDSRRDLGEGCGAGSNWLPRGSPWGEPTSTFPQLFVLLFFGWILI